jgi:peptide/nickel transport system substrate-binding protein
MKKLVFVSLILVLVFVSLCAACQGTTTSQTQTTAQSTSKPTTLATTSQATATSQTVTGKWWDKLGVPKYGGAITIPTLAVQTAFDPALFMFAQYCFVYEGMFYPDWTLDRNIWPMAGMFVPEKYFAGNLAESWELTDQQTLTIHLRKGVVWQNKYPVNGREFTSEDAVFHFDRMLGTGHGYTSPSPYSAMMTGNWKNVTAVDKYTIQIHFKNPCGGVAFFSASDQAAFLWFEAPEWVALGGPPPAPAAPPAGGEGGGGPPPGPPEPPSPSGPLYEWKNVVGTGPWILSDFVNATSMKYSRNPTYWGHDPRYPQNQVPYADTMTILQIPDTATQVAALRTGKIDYLASVDLQHSQTLQNTDLQNAKVASITSGGLLYRNDLKPYSDIKVRIALDMAINRPEIAKGLLSGITDGTPCGMVTPAYKGWAYTYDEWPQSLKDEYSYNPTKAKELLAEAGYPNGFKTNAVISSASTAIVQLVQVYKSYFADIGVDVEIRPMDQVAFTNFVRSAKCDAMSEGGAGNDFPPTRLIEMFTSKSSDSAQIGLVQQPDTVYDGLRDKFWAATTPEEAQAAIHDADKRVIEQHYGVFMTGFASSGSSGSGYNFWQPYLKGYTNEAIFWQQQILWARLWIDTDLKKTMGK